MFQLEFRDSPDSYKPVNRSLWEFLQQKESLIAQSANIKTFYEKVCTHEMNVFIHDKAEEHLKEHLTIDSYTETGGVLVGQAYFCQKTNSYYTEIVGAISAINTIGNRVHFEFTPESWKEIYKIRERDFPENIIVGWYHSHPGHGIFLSGTDLTTQRSCYNQIWQIAVVYDPINRQIGFFYGADGKKLEPIYLENSSQQLQWREESQQVPPQEELQPHRTEPQLPPVSTSEQAIDRSEVVVFPPSEPESSEEPKGQNSDSTILDIALKIIFIPVSLWKGMLAKISKSSPPNSQPPQSPQSELQPPDSEPEQPK